MTSAHELLALLTGWISTTPAPVPDSSVCVDEAPCGAAFLPHANVTCTGTPTGKQRTSSQRRVFVTLPFFVVVQRCFISPWILVFCFFFTASPLPFSVSPPLCGLHSRLEWQIWFVTQTVKKWPYSRGFSLFQVGHDSDRCNVICASGAPFSRRKTPWMMRQTTCWTSCGV